MRVYRAWIKRYCVLCSKNIEMGANCHKFRSSSRPPAWSARICESRLLGHPFLRQWLLSIQCWANIWKNADWWNVSFHWKTFHRYLVKIKRRHSISNNIFRLLSVGCLCLDPGASELPHWGRDKMVTNLQTTFLNAFSYMNIDVFWSKLHWNFFPRSYLTMNHYWFW